MAHLPNFEGDDLRRLVNEIKKAMQYLKQAITFNKMYDKRENLNDGNYIDIDILIFFLFRKTKRFNTINIFFFNIEIIIGPIHINNSKKQTAPHKSCNPVDFMM